MTYLEQTHEWAVMKAMEANAEAVRLQRKAGMQVPPCGFTGYVEAAQLWLQSQVFDLWEDERGYLEMAKRLGDGDPIYDSRDLELAGQLSLFGRGRSSNA